MTNLPLFSYPSTIVLVDDDKLFLKAITRFLGHKHSLKTFSDASESLDFFKNYKPLLPSMPFLKGCLEHESYDTVEHMPVDLNAEMFRELRQHPNRSQDINVIVIDYNMPNINGIELCRKLSGLPIKKILLTGETDHFGAVSAFNDGLIDRFIRKDNPKLVEELLLYIEILTQQNFIDNTRGLLSHLEADYSLPVSDPEFCSFFKNWCNTRKICEYYIIDKQGNFIVVDEQKESFYFITHTDRTLSAFVELHQDDENIADLVDAVSKRSLIPFFGLGKEAWQQKESEWPAHFYTPELFEGKEKYFWTVIRKDAYCD